MANSETQADPDLDAALVARAKAGDADALRDLYRRHERRAYHLALRMLGNPWDAADATQEAFVKALTNLEGFRGTAQFGTWLHRIVANVVYDHLRRRRTEPMDDETMDRLSSTPAGPGANPFGRGVDPVMDGLSPEVRDALLSLDDSFRMTVVLCDLLGYSYAEAAEILEVQEGTVKSRLFRARSALATRLVECGYAVPGAERPGPSSPDVGTGMGGPARNQADQTGVTPTKTADAGDV